MLSSKSLWRKNSWPVFEPHSGGFTMMDADLHTWIYHLRSSQAFASTYSVHWPSGARGRGTCGVPCSATSTGSSSSTPPTATQMGMTRCRNERPVIARESMCALTTVERNDPSGGEAHRAGVRRMLEGACTPVTRTEKRARNRTKRWKRSPGRVLPREDSAATVFPAHRGAPEPDLG